METSQPDEWEECSVGSYPPGKYGRRVLCGPCHEASGRRAPCGPCHTLFSAWQILFFECNHQVKVYTFHFLYPRVHTLVWSLACLSHEASGRRVPCGPCHEASGRRVPCGSCHEASGRRVPCGPCHQASGRRVPCGPCHQVTQFCLSCTH